jgi:hypothetical protein
MSFLPAVQIFFMRRATANAERGFEGAHCIGSGRGINRGRAINPA